MSDEHTKPHPAIRTFAQDLAVAREKRGQSSADSSSPSEENNPVAEIKKPAEHFKAQAPSQTTHTEPKITVGEKVVKKPETAQAPTRPAQQNIPAFHELKKNTTIKSTLGKTESKKIVPKISVKKSHSPSKPNIGYDATIITDNKNEGFSLLGTVSASVKSWFKALIASKKKKAPIYTVPDTERRKGVIQKATSKSGSIFTADSAELKAKIKQRQKLAEAKKADGQEEGELSWSPYTDSGFALLESPEETARVSNPHNVSVEFKRHSQPSDAVSESNIPPVPAAPTAVHREKTAIESTPDTHPTDVRWEPIVEKVQPVAEPESIPEPEPEPESKSIPEPEPEPKDAPQAPISTEEPKNIPTQPGSAHLNIQSLNTNILAMSIVAGLSCIVVIFFVTKAVIGYVTSTETIVTYDTTSYLQTATPNPVVVVQTNSITDIPLQAGTLLDLNYVDTQLFMQNGDAVPPATLIAALKFKMLPSFIQSLTDVRFAQKNKTQPILIFEFSDANTALGGFLAWEDTMARDLKEIYLITQPDTAVFTDDTIAGKDVRILQTATGETLAVYGIVSNDTALIAGSVDIFIQVLNASFSN